MKKISFSQFSQFFQSFFRNQYFDRNCRSQNFAGLKCPQKTKLSQQNFVMVFEL